MGIEEGGLKGGLTCGKERVYEALERGGAVHGEDDEAQLGLACTCAHADGDVLDGPHGSVEERLDQNEGRAREQQPQRPSSKRTSATAPHTHPLLERQSANLAMASSTPSW